MQVIDFLRSVRDGKPVNDQEIEDFVFGVAKGTIPDYQAAAFCMAVYCRGLADASTVALTRAMRDSGSVIDLKHVPGIKVDKHSTGGVGDKISLPLAPLVAACGVPVPMISGRGLGHSGGTLDKLESIPGFRVDLPIDHFRRQVKELGVCLIGQTKDLAPADKKLYSLRDVTATVESIPLITGSILSKKLAEGIDALVLDVKVGRGAFMKDIDAARQLAESLVRVGSGAGLKIRALLTRMEEPIGKMIGNALEVREAIDVLNGQGPQDTIELTLALGAEMLVLGGKAKNTTEGKKQLQTALDSGLGREKLKAIIAAQHGDPKVVDHPERLPVAHQQSPVLADQAGFITSIDSFALGQAAVNLGAGRTRAEDSIDPAVGIEMTTRVGDRVLVGETLAIVHHNKPAPDCLTQIRRGFAIDSNPPQGARPLIIDKIES